MKDKFLSTSANLSHNNQVVLNKPMDRSLPLIKFPLSWTLVLVITIALLFNTPIARTTKPLSELKITLQVSQMTSSGRSRRWITLPLLGF
ncbi:MAG: hypothetical protein C4288_19860 [Leptolyngbya sp. ERB_1_1]